MNGAAFWRKVRAHFDWALFLTLLAIATIGLVNLYSATRVAPRGLFDSQVRFILLGFVVFLVTAAIDYRVWLRFAWIFLGVGVVAVIAVHFVGYSVKGSQRWIFLGPANVQPSELMKIAVILALGRFLHDKASEGMSLGRFALSIGAFVVAICMIAWQPDLGTATLVSLICLSVTFLAARRLWPIFAGLIALGASFPILWSSYFHKYQKDRIRTFLDPSSDPSGAGWHARQSILAIGSGRVGGKGYLHGTQNQLNFLPEHWSDFPFSVWAEEWGFAGSVALLGLYLFLILWIVNVASQARDRFGATICVGVAAMLFWHVFVNIAMVTGLAPVVGVTLPLISHGGSSLLTFFIGFGLVASVSMRRWSH